MVMFMAALEKKRSCLSPLDVRFHVRDLIGSGHFENSTYADWNSYAGLKRLNEGVLSNPQLDKTSSHVIIIAYVF